MTPPPNSSSFFGQEPPVVFFAAGPPTQGFPGRYGPQSSPFHADGPHAHHHKTPWAFLAKLAVAILSLFAVSMAIRIFLSLVALAFSPPVLLLCLVTLVLSNTQGFTSRSSNGWNTSDFQGCFYDPRRFRHFFGCPRPRAGRCGSARRRGSVGNNGSSTNRNATDTTGTAVNTSQTPATPTNATQNTRTASPSDDFEMSSPFQLMMAAATNTTSTEEQSPDNEETSSEGEEEATQFSQQQRVPVHRQETKQDLIISMDISGFDPDELKITVENENNTDFLYIRGERVNKIGDRFAVKESFELDPEAFDLESVAATASDGVLQVKVGKKDPPQPRVISIQVKKEE